MESGGEISLSAREEMFGEGASSLSLPALVHDLVECSVTDPAFMLFLRLLRYARLTAYNREAAHGWIRLGVSREQLERDRNRSGASVSKYFRELEDLGAIRREQRGPKTWDTYVRYLPLLAQELYERPEVMERARKRFATYLDKVECLPEPTQESGVVTALPEGGSCTRCLCSGEQSASDAHERRSREEYAPSEARDPDEEGPEEEIFEERAFAGDLPSWRDVKEGRVKQNEDEFVEWMGERKSKTADLLVRTHRLTQEIAASAQRTTERREHRESKKSTFPKKKSAPKKDRPHDLVKEFRRAVDVRLGLIPEPESKKLLGQMGHLVRRHGAARTRTMIRYVTSEEGWAEIKRRIWQFRDELVPTVGKVLQMDAQILNLMQETSTPKRSGGAKDLSEEQLADESTWSF